MPRMIYVAGHGNLGAESEVSAVAYAELLSRQSIGSTVTTCRGDLWPETRFVLERFGLTLPTLPRVTQ